MYFERALGRRKDLFWRDCRLLAPLSRENVDTQKDKQHGSKLDPNRWGHCLFLELTRTGVSWVLKGTVQRHLEKVSLGSACGTSRPTDSSIGLNSEPTELCEMGIEGIDKKVFAFIQCPREPNHCYWEQQCWENEPPQNLFQLFKKYEPWLQQQPAHTHYLFNNFYIASETGSTIHTVVRVPLSMLSWLGKFSNQEGLCILSGKNPTSRPPWHFQIACTAWSSKISLTRIGIYRGSSQPIGQRTWTLLTWNSSIRISKVWSDLDSFSSASSGQARWGWDWRLSQRWEDT